MNALGLGLSLIAASVFGAVAVAVTIDAGARNRRPRPPLPTALRPPRQPLRIIDTCIHRFRFDHAKPDHEACPFGCFDGASADAKPPIVPTAPRPPTTQSTQVTLHEGKKPRAGFDPPPLPKMDHRPDW